MGTAAAARQAIFHEVSFFLLQNISKRNEELMRRTR